MSEGTNWTTDDEIKFITQLGSQSLTGQLRERPALLRGYLVATDSRFDWCKLDRPRIIEHAKAELAAYSLEMVPA